MAGVHLLVSQEGEDSPQAPEDANVPGWSWEMVATVCCPGRTRACLEFPRLCTPLQCLLRSPPILALQ